MFGMSVRKTGALRAVLLGSVAASMIAPAQAAETVDIEALERQMQILIQEIQELKSQQLEQARTIEEQNKKLNAQGQEIQAQQEQVEAVEEAVVAAPAQAVTGGDHPGSFKLPGSNTSMKIGGYTKGDLYYDVDQDLGDTFNTVFLAPDGVGRDRRLPSAVEP
jgi:TolA-binding protein